MITIDIETECTVTGCSDNSCDHALNPATSRITVVGLKHADWELATRDLSEVESLIKHQHLCAFNFKFEHLHLNYHGVHVSLEQWAADPMLMAYVSTNKIPNKWLEDYEANRPQGHRKAGKHSLKTLAPYYLGVQPYWEVVNKDDDQYVLTDVRYTYQLYEYFMIHSTPEELDFGTQKLLPWTKMLVEAEQRGVVIDLHELNHTEVELYERSLQLRLQLDEQWRREHERYYRLQVAAVEEKYAHQKINKSWNTRQETARSKCATKVDYDSPKQMLWLLRDQLGYDCTTFEGDQSTGKEVLQRLSVDHSDVEIYLEWRSVNKLLTAFIPTYRESAVTGVMNNYAVIHPVYNPANTRTGRTSSERPNMQQVPPKLRSLFKARPGYKFVGYDMGAIEAKLIAYYSEDEQLTQLIKTGVSLHDFNAKTFFDLPGTPAEVGRDNKAERAAAKNVGFALFYNAGYNRIKVALAQKGFHFTDGQCKAIHKRFKAAYPGAVRYASEVVKQFEEGEVVPNLLGRPLRIEDPQDAYMQGFNTLIQSSASDLLLESAHNALVKLRDGGIEAYPVLFVHDFVCFEVEESKAEFAAHILKVKMVNHDLAGIPLTVEGGISDRWEK